MNQDIKDIENILNSISQMLRDHPEFKNNSSCSKWRQLILELCFILEQGNFYENIINKEEEFSRRYNFLASIRYAFLSQKNSSNTHFNANFQNINTLEMSFEYIDSAIAKNVFGAIAYERKLPNINTLKSYIDEYFDTNPYQDNSYNGVIIPILPALKIFLKTIS